MSSHLTASVMKTILQGLRRLVTKTITFENYLRLCSRKDETQSTVGACGVELPDALTKVVAAPYVVVLNVNLQNGYSLLICSSAYTSSGGTYNNGKVRRQIFDVASEFR